MSEISGGKRYVFEFSGDFVELVVAPVPKDKAELWLERDGEELFAHAFGRDEDADTSDPAFLGEASFIEGAKRFEGCELKNGTLEIRDEFGNDVSALSTESDEFQNAVDDFQKIEMGSYLIDGGPTLVTRSSGSGTVAYHPDTPVENLEEAGWYVFVMETETEPFVSNFFFEGQEVQPSTGGPYNVHEVCLLVPQPNGEVYQSYFSARSGEL